ncbi:MAG: zinc ribbon domain-containing protein [Planctomycetes bacterium]|nr:zinc ribbon domain-containing protein [Planctomycetota bacterium]
MPIKVICEDCGHEKLVKDKYAGQEIECPGCGAPVTVPDPQAEVEAEAEPEEPVEAEPEEAGPSRPSRKGRGDMGARRRGGSRGGEGGSAPPTRKSRSARRGREGRRLAPVVSKQKVYLPLAYAGMVVPGVGVAAFLMAKGEADVAAALIPKAQDQEDDERLSEYEAVADAARKGKLFGLIGAGASVAVWLTVWLVISLVAGGRREEVKKRGVDIVRAALKEVLPGYQERATKIAKEFDLQAAYDKEYDTDYKKFLDKYVKVNEIAEGKEFKSTPNFRKEWKDKKDEIHGRANTNALKELNNAIKKVAQEFNETLRSKVKGKAPEFENQPDKGEQTPATFGVSIAFPGVKGKWSLAPTEGDEKKAAIQIEKDIDIPPLAYPEKFKLSSRNDADMCQEKTPDEPRVTVKWLFDNLEPNGTMRLTAKSGETVVTCVMKYE